MNVIHKIKDSRGRGFTLVELLAVIVILAIILVIAVPKVMSVIEDAKKATLESTAKMIASQAEKQKVQNTVLGKDETITCEGITNINDVDYASCEITFENNTAKVTIEGSGKFEGLYICSGTKTSAVATDEGCRLICEYGSKKMANAVMPYEVKDYDACMNYLEPIILSDDWGGSEGELIGICKNKIYDYFSFEHLVQNLIYEEYFTEEELISNNIVAADSVFEENNITLGNANSCVNYTKDVVIDEWGYDEEWLASYCSNVENLNFLVNDLLWAKIFTPEELIQNNVVGSDSIFTNIKPGNQTSCVNNFKDIVVNNRGYTESELQTICSGEDINVVTMMDNLIMGGNVSELELIENNIIVGTVEEECYKEGCFEFNSETGSITNYNESCGVETIFIPEKISGFPVMNIERNALPGSGKIINNSLHIPNDEETWQNILGACVMIEQIRGNVIIYDGSGPC